MPPRHPQLLIVHCPALPQTPGNTDGKKQVLRAWQEMGTGMAMVARRAHHSKLLEVLPELRLAAVVGNAPDKDLVGFAAVAPGSFLLSRRGVGGRVCVSDF